MNPGLVVLAVAMVLAALLLRRRAEPGGWSELIAKAAAEAEATRSLQAKADQTAASVTALAAQFEERRRLEEAATVAVGRIERLVAGSWSKGRVGENLLAAALSEFPPGMVERDFTIGGRVCEFALLLADGKLLAIDSKWPALDVVTRLEAEVDPGAQEVLRRQVEKAVCAHLREVSGYVDCALTAPLAVMALPDSVYACCRRAHRVAKELRVLLVSYSLAVPVLMAVWNLYGTYGREVDHAQLLDRLQDVSHCLRELGERIEGQLSRGIKMSGNAAAEMRTLVTTARTSLDAIRVATPHEPLPTSPFPGDLD